MHSLTNATRTRNVERKMQPLQWSSKVRQSNCDNRLAIDKRRAPTNTWKVWKHMAASEVKTADANGKHRKQSQNRNGIKIAPRALLSHSAPPQQSDETSKLLFDIYDCVPEHKTTRDAPICTCWRLEVKQTNAWKEKLAKRKNICSEMENLYAMSGKRIRKRHAQQVPTHARPPPHKQSSAE